MKQLILEIIVIALVLASGANTLVTMAEAHAQTSLNLELDRINDNLAPGQYELDASELEELNRGVN